MKTDEELCKMTLQELWDEKMRVIKEFEIYTNKLDWLIDDYLDGVIVRKLDKDE